MIRADKPDCGAQALRTHRLDTRDIEFLVTCERCGVSTEHTVTFEQLVAAGPAGPQIEFVCQRGVQKIAGA